MTTNHGGLGIQSLCFKLDTVAFNTCCFREQVECIKRKKKLSFWKSLCFATAHVCLRRHILSLFKLAEMVKYACSWPKFGVIFKCSLLIFFKWHMFITSNLISSLSLPSLSIYCLNFFPLQPFPFSNSKLKSVQEFLEYLTSLNLL